MRLDLALAGRLGISRRKARELIAAKRVLVNGRRVAIASREVSPSDHLTAVKDEASLAIIRASEGWIAVNKPAGLPTQPTRARSPLSLEEMMRAQYREIFLVHRLDTGTSGVVLFARTRTAAAALSQLFAGGEIRKTYLALVEGAIETELVLDAPIRGKCALTVVRPIRRAADGTVVEVELKTGRTHQIRIHLSGAGHPVAGDRRYGSSLNPSRLMLHAWKLEHASFGLLEAPVPPEFV